ncbi:MAG TPA: DUF4160 domain-containing protein [Bryobacteraceae bacterium]|nr:DUF4160 domain-containing protein [Bryobacteraceae bacterium]
MADVYGHKNGETPPGGHAGIALRPSCSTRAFAGVGAVQTFFLCGKRAPADYSCLIAKAAFAGTGPGSSRSPLRRYSRVICQSERSLRRLRWFLNNPRAWEFGYNGSVAHGPQVCGVRVVIYPNDHRPAHVHVIGRACEAVFNLNCPARPVQLRENYGFSRREIAQIERTLTEHLNKLCGEWERIHEIQ